MGSAMPALLRSVRLMLTKVPGLTMVLMNEY
jgi:hypothetical protein